MMEGRHDVGCRTGEHVLLATEHGAQAMGVDVSDLAIERAWEKAEARDLDVTCRSVTYSTWMSSAGSSTPSPTAASA